MNSELAFAIYMVIVIIVIPMIIGIRILIDVSKVADAELLEELVKKHELAEQYMSYLHEIGDATEQDFEDAQWDIDEAWEDLQMALGVTGENHKISV